MGKVIAISPKAKPSTSKFSLEEGVARPKSVPSNGGAVFRGIIQNSLFVLPGLLAALIKTNVEAAFNALLTGAESVIVVALTTVCTVVP